MDLLQQARAEIDTVDAEMAALFERRMRAVADVVRYKAETGKPVFDAAREAAVLDKNTARITDEALRPYYRAFLSVAPGTPSRSCRIGRSHIRAMIISGWVYSRSSTVETSPALEFSNGSTPNCASPFCTASKT